MLFYFRVLDWCSAYILNQVLFRDIGDVLLITAYGEQVIKGLVLTGPDMFRNRLIPFVSMIELGINVKDDAPEIIMPMFYNLAKSELRGFLNCPVFSQN